MDSEQITLQEYCKRLSQAVATAEGVQNVWVVAELSDVRTNASGHCYMELIQKHEDGSDLAKIRAVIWRSAYARLSAKFTAETGQTFSTGLKVCVMLTASLHPVYGLSVVITDIDASFTLGDVIRRRKEIIDRLRCEGILDINKSIQFADVPQRVAVISSATAAGYGDFVNQLYRNAYRLRFDVKLFPAMMQGESTAPTVIEALNRVEAEDAWDCVVIIRGGGATSDLLAFDNYDLAAKVAQFPVPVIVGIGHERDVTVLDDIAAYRVKTPTAAAELLIGFGKAMLDRIDSLASSVVNMALGVISAYREQLAHYQSTLPLLPVAAVRDAENRLVRLSSSVASVKTAIEARRTKIASLISSLTLSSAHVLSRRKSEIDSVAALLGALSPEATLRRGYSITRINGRAVTSIDDVAQGAKVTTIVADGVISSTVDSINANK